MLFYRIETFLDSNILMLYMLEEQNDISMQEEIELFKLMIFVTFKS